MKKALSFRKALSLVCTFAILLSCMVLYSATSVSALTDFTEKFNGTSTGGCSYPSSGGGDNMVRSNSVCAKENRSAQGYNDSGEMVMEYTPSASYTILGFRIWSSKPEAGQYFRVSFYYKVNSTKGNNTLTVAYGSNNWGTHSLASNLQGIKKEAVTFGSNAELGVWKKASVNIYTDNKNAFHIALTGDGANVSIDDVRLEQKSSAPTTYTFDYNDGKTTENAEYYPGDTIDYPTPTRRGYAFQGWYTTTSFTTKAPATAPSSKATYYAKWEATNPLYTVDFQVDGASVQSYEGITGDPYEIPTVLADRFGYEYTWADASGNAPDGVIGNANKVYIGTLSKLVESFEKYTVTGLIVGSSEINGISTAKHIVQGGAKTGNKSLAMQMKYPANGMIARFFPKFAGEAVSTVEDGKYSLNFWLKSSKTDTFHLVLGSKDNLQNIFAGNGKDAVYEEDIPLTANVWTEVTLTDIDGFTDGYLTIGGGFAQADENAYVYLDDLHIEKDEPIQEDTTLGDYEYATKGDVIELVTGVDSHVDISDNFNHTPGKDKTLSARFFGDIGNGNSRAQAVLTDHYGNKVQVNAGKTYTVSFWIYAPTNFTYKSGSNTPNSFRYWLAVADDHTAFSASYKKDDYKVKETGALTDFQMDAWKQYTETFTSPHDGYLRIGMSETSGSNQYEFYMDDVVVKGEGSENPLPLPEIDDDDNSYISSEVLYHTDFDTDTVGSIARGWEEDAPAWGFVGSGASHSATVVSKSPYGNVLELKGQNCAAWAIAPEINSRNYIYETNVLIVSGSGSRFGIANCIPARLANVGNAGTNEAKMYVGNTRAPYYSSSGAGGYEKFSDETFALPEGVTLNPGTTVNLKVVSANGRNTLYIDGTKVASHAQSETGSDSDSVGFYFYGVTIDILDVTVTQIETAKISCADKDLVIKGDSTSPSVQVQFPFSIAKDSYLVKTFASEPYQPDTDALQFGVLTALCDDNTVLPLTVNTEGVNNVPIDLFTQDENAIRFTYTETIPAKDYDRYVTVRPYAKIGDDYYYANATNCSASRLATGAYKACHDEKVKSLLDAVFSSSKNFVGSSLKTVKFTAFSDFHYNYNGTIQNVSDLRNIMNRANATESDFVLSCGDMVMDPVGSPEFFNACLYNEYDLPFYNVYGNHELEGPNASTGFITPRLTNDSTVHWGTSTGAMDTDIGYYWFEQNGFRFIALDTNYWLDTEGNYHHNSTNSYGYPSSAVTGNCLGDVQMAWLEETLMDAAYSNIPCVVIGHVGMDGVIRDCSDGPTVRAIFHRANALKAGTVMMYICGHEHWDRRTSVDGVFYLYVNCPRGITSDRRTQQTGNYPYKGKTFLFEEYDANGSLIRTYERQIQSLNVKFAYYATDTMSAVITLTSDGTIQVDGIETTWLYDEECAPGNPELYPGMGPRIESGVYQENALDVGHLYTDVWQYNRTQHWHGCNLCDGEKTDVGDHHFVEGYCDVCGAKEPGNYALGDVDGNDSVDAVDLTRLARHVAKIEYITDKDCLVAADVDKNGDVNAVDLTILARHVAKIEFIVDE